MELYIIRHGRTRANELNLYVGRTDHPLSEGGIQQAQQYAQATPYPQVDRVYVSPLARARQTAAILFPQAEQLVVEGFIEMDFGDFEGLHSDDLQGNPHFVPWQETKQAPSYPNGESGADFNARVQTALSELIAQAFEAGEERLVVVTHEGVGMTIMANRARPKLPFYRWVFSNCEGYRIQVEKADWDQGRFTSWETLGGESWKNRSFSFTQNRDCEFFPCHAVEDPRDFNCLFCFCPLYHWDADCPGTPRYTKRGIKDCSACLLPHERDSYGLITKNLGRS
ncbi:MAG: histidine phosphatase family protein [Coriobacteriia bacterium]|nr:histidine phosphatase family protein [Coriobacteriia bacterium]